MRRALLWLAAAALAFGAIAVVKRWPGAEQPADAGAAARRQRIRAFWDPYNAATAARTRGDFRGAAPLYRKALTLNPQHEDSLFYTAVCAQELGRYAEAADTLRRLIALSPHSSRAYSQLGTLLSTQAPGAIPDFEGALAAFARNEEINHEEAGAFLRRGLLQLGRGELDAARRSFATASGSGAPEALYFSGLTDYLQGKDASAVGMFVRVLQANEHEKAITGRGVFSEGDVASDVGQQRLTAFERAGIRSLLFLYWSSRRLGGYPKAVDDRFRLHPERLPGHASRFALDALPGDVSSRGAWIDQDRDGRPDLLLLGPRGVRLLRNTPAGWLDVSRATGLADIARAWDACVFDEDGDGWSDVYLVRKGYIGAGQNALLRNEHGRLRDVTAERGLAGERATAHAVAADLAGDGRVDLLELGNAGGGSAAVRLFVREGAGFAERAASLGLGYDANAVDAAVADFDGDGAADLFVLGWKATGRLFRRTKSGFEDVTAQAGLAGVGGDGLSVAALDYDRDGRPDLLVTARAPHELSLLRLLSPGLAAARQTPRLFHNLGQGRFAETTAAVGLNRWYGVMQAVPADVDGDGWTDLVLANGGLERERLEPSLVLRNDGGHRFEEWAFLPGFDRPVNAVGAAVADANGDGRLDIFLSGAGLLKGAR